MFFSPYQAEKALPKTYDTISKDFSQTRNRPWEEFEDLVKKTTKGKKILDIGCGNGRLLHYLSNYFEGDIEYNGIDISEELLKEAITNKKINDQQLMINNLFQKGSFLKIPFKNNSFDEVWAIASFHHLSREKDRIKALQEISRVLRSNGEFVFTVWNLWEQEKYFPQKKESQIRAFWNPFWTYRDFLIPFGKDKISRYYYNFSEKYIRQLLEENGFEVVEIFYSRLKRNLCVRAKVMKNYELQTTNEQKEQNTMSKIQKEENNKEAVLRIYPKKINILDIPFHIISEEEVVDFIMNYELRMMNDEENHLEFKISNSKFLKIFTPNPEMMVEAEENPKFKEILQKADISLPDGNGILWASGLGFLQERPLFWRWILGIFSLFYFTFFRKYFPKKIKKTVCGSDVFKRVITNYELRITNKKEKENDSKFPRIFLLGGSFGSAKYIAEHYKGIVGYFDEKVSAENTSKIIDKINYSGAEILFVALGAPKQEFWICENEKKIKNIRVAMGVGGSFDFISGHQKRAPKFFQEFGIEWIYRLLNEPQRIKRIWNATGKFIALVIKKMENA